MKCLLRFSIAKSEKYYTNHQIPIFGFQCVAKYIEGRFKIYTSYLIYSHISLNLPLKDH